MTIEAAGDARSILRDPVFARLWFIQAANQVGGNMALYALTVLVYSTTRSNSAVSALLVSFVLPQIALSPFAGVIVARADEREDDGGDGEGDEGMLGPDTDDELTLPDLGNRVDRFVWDGTELTWDMNITKLRSNGNRVIQYSSVVMPKRALTT